MFPYAYGLQLASIHHDVAFIDRTLLILFLAEVGPKKILDTMKVPGLTRENVASHLQVFLFRSCSKHS